MPEPAAAVTGALSEAVRSVLETMFFLTAESDSEGSAGPGGIEVKLKFKGRPSGAFALQVPQETAADAAANFLGLDEERPTPEQVQDVISEMANMICGSLLSHLEKTAAFEISHAGPGRLDDSPGTIHRVFDVDGRDVGASIRFWSDGAED